VAMATGKMLIKRRCENDSTVLLWKTKRRHRNCQRKQHFAHC